MKEKEIKHHFQNWKLVLALCLISLATISCGSLEKPTRARPTAAPTPTTFPAYKYFNPIPQVKEFTDPKKICEQRHFETYETFGTTQGKYIRYDPSPHHQVVEITYRQLPRTTLETTAFLLPATPQLVFDIVPENLEQITDRQITIACDENRIFAEWFQKSRIDNFYSANIPNHKFLPIKKNSQRAEDIMKQVALSYHPNRSDFIPIPMKIVP